MVDKFDGAIPTRSLFALVYSSSNHPESDSGIRTGIIVTFYQKSSGTWLHKQFLRKSPSGAFRSDAFLTNTLKIQVDRQWLYGSIVASRAFEQVLKHTLADLDITLRLGLAGFKKFSDIQRVKAKSGKNSS